MAPRKLQPWSAPAWALARKQHGVVTREQLLDLGLGAEAIRHRLASGRLHRLSRGIYVVGRPELSERGRWMAAVLSCGPGARLSHRSAATLWGIQRPPPGERLRSGACPRPEPIEVVVPLHVYRRRPGIRVHRHANLDPRRRRIVDDIPVTDPVSTLVDIATLLPDGELSAAINEADHLDLVSRPRLRRELDSLPSRRGIGRLRALFARQELALPATVLEQRFLRIVQAAKLPLPETQASVNGHRVDFRWPRHGLVVEADSLRYHRTPERQSADMRRDHAHVSAGLTTLRFSHEQIRHEPDYVRRTLAANLARLQGEPARVGA